MAESIVCFAGIVVKKTIFATRKDFLSKLRWRGIIEETRELQCKAPDLVSLRTKDDLASLSDLDRSSLRLRADRIPIGEGHGAEELDLLKACGTAFRWHRHRSCGDCFWRAKAA